MALLGLGPGTVGGPLEIKVALASPRLPELLAHEQAPVVLDVADYSAAMRGALSGVAK
jgi:hypothetical protein